ncbi:MAG: M1 family peptidase [Actinobacteria bacterium]|nr:MAG: M1 family peptidase [Actinomycetota bacterium]
MRSRVPGLIFVLVVTGAACSPESSDGTTTTEAPATTATAATTTTTEAPATTTTALEVDRSELSGIGDVYYPTLGNGGYEVEHYLLDLEYDPATRVLDAEVTIDTVATANLDTFNLDFRGFEIGSITVDGEEARFDRNGDELEVWVDSTIGAGEGFSVAVSYTGEPTSMTSRALFGEQIGWLRSPGQDFVAAEPEGAHSWFPCNDHPTDRARYTFRITVPSGTTAAANGILVDEIDDGETHTWVWELRDEMVTYLATVVIGEFEIVTDDASAAIAGVPVRNVLPPDLAAAPNPGLARQGEMLAWMSELFGPYPFEASGIAAIQGFPGALENQTLSLFDRGLVEDPFGTNELFPIVLVHELAHQWFGNLITLGQWKDIWLNEGFASYTEWLWTEREEGRAAMEEQIRAERDLWADAAVMAPGEPLPTALFGGEVYRVGAMTLHALRLTVGDDAFFDILRTYLDRHAGRTAVTEDFIAVAEEVSGRDLTDLFDAWLFQIAVPEFPDG